MTPLLFSLYKRCKKDLKMLILPSLSDKSRSGTTIHNIPRSMLKQRDITEIFSRHSDVADRNGVANDQAVRLSRWRWKLWARHATGSCGRRWKKNIVWLGNWQLATIFGWWILCEATLAFSRTECGRISALNGRLWEGGSGEQNEEQEKCYHRSSVV